MNMDPGKSPDNNQAPKGQVLRNSSANLSGKRTLIRLTLKGETRGRASCRPFLYFPPTITKERYIMNIPAELVYAETDEWLKVDGSDATIGVSDYAQDQLSDVVFIDYVVSVGDTVEKGQHIVTVESVKAAADVLAPVSGRVTAVNEDLPQSPELVNKDPYAAAWMVKLEITNPAEARSLMNSDAYMKYLQERSH
jgi:glycine cleavage system H protein